MAIYQSKKPTKDGRSYFFRIKYKDIMGITHDYTSPKFKKRSEAVDEEALYRIKVQQQSICTTTLTFEQIYEEYFFQKSKSIKKTTQKRISTTYRHLEPIKKIKINDFNLAKYKMFSKYVEDLGFDITYSNKIMCLLKNLIKYSNGNNRTIFTNTPNMDKFIFFHTNI